MITQIAPARLREIREQGRSAESADGPFVNPRTVYRSRVVLGRRAETWAASVLGRDLSRRALLARLGPWLEPGDMTALILADAEEDRVVFAEITS